MSNNSKKSALFAALLALGFAGSTLAQLAPKSKPPSHKASASLSHEDREFANKAAANGSQQKGLLGRVFGGWGRKG